ncbi:MAG: hypothetical protein ACRCUS_01965, partial [Anaerovoracaceae bacterium]
MKKKILEAVIIMVLFIIGSTASVLAAGNDTFTGTGWTDVKNWIGGTVISYGGAPSTLPKMPLEPETDFVSFRAIPNSDAGAAEMVRWGNSSSFAPDMYKNYYNNGKRDGSTVYSAFPARYKTGFVLAKSSKGNIGITVQNAGFVTRKNTKNIYQQYRLGVKVTWLDWGLNYADKSGY